MAQKDGVKKMILDAWENSVCGMKKDCVFRDRLNNVKNDLKCWSRNEFGSLDKKINFLKEKACRLELLAESGTISDADRTCWLETRKSWIEKERIKTGMMKKKAWIRGPNSGSISGGRLDSGPRIIGSNIRGSRPCTIGPISRPRVGNSGHSEANDLEVVFSEAEIWEAVKDCRSSKAPGSDGDLIEAINMFWEKGEMSMGCNSSFIALISKKSYSISLNDYCPISLIGSFYIVIAKLPVNHLKRVIPNLVGFKQSPFIKGRNILDGALVANETLS
ncbi:uncharacterized protein [Rutidosis leptorrhynchoides]|uniref:uncharacterized protein n=1 Tax=Rutidosis leptorrhynchoides TaxID=125765 RepID=UPI003A99FAF6